MTHTPLSIDGPTLTFLVVALVFLAAGAGLALLGALRARRHPVGRLVPAVVVLRPDGYGEGFPDRRPDFEWTDESGQVQLAHSSGTLVPGLWVGDEVKIRLDPRDESRATLVVDTPPRRELVLVGVACIIVGILLGAVGLNEWL